LARNTIRSSRRHYPIETDEQVKVVVFDSAIDGFFMTHYDFLAKVEETTSLPPDRRFAALPDMLSA